MRHFSWFYLLSRGKSASYCYLRHFNAFQMNKYLCMRKYAFMCDLMQKYLFTLTFVRMHFLRFNLVKCNIFVCQPVSAF